MPGPRSLSEIEADIDRLISTRPTRASIGSRLWSGISEPLTDLPSRAARKVSKGIFGARENLSGTSWGDRVESLIGFNPNPAAAIGFYEGATEGLGDVLTSLTSPIDLALTASGAGALSRGARTASLARKAFTAANIASGARGTQNIIKGLDYENFGNNKNLESLITGQEEWNPDLSLIGAGSLELLGAGAGFHGRSITPERVPQPTAEVKIPRPNPVKTEVIKAPVSPLKVNDPLRAVKSGDYGITLGDIDPQTGMRIRPEMRSSTNQRVFDALLPSSIRDKVLANEIGPMQLSEPGLLEPIESVLAKPKKVKKIKIPKTPVTPVTEAPVAKLTPGSNFTGVSDDTLKILVKTGNKDAIRELANRRGETGSATIDLLTGGLFRNSPSETLPEFAPVGDEISFNATRRNPDPLEFIENRDVSQDFQSNKYLGNRQLQRMRSSADKVREAAADARPLDLLGNEKGSVPLKFQPKKKTYEQTWELIDESGKVHSTYSSESSVNAAKSFLNRPNSPVKTQYQIRRKPGTELGSKVLDIFEDESGAVRTDILSAPFKGLGTRIKDTVNLNLINQDLPNVKKIKDDYQTWVNKRNARKGLSFQVTENFKDLKDLGMEGIFAYNKGERGGRFADVQDFFDKYHADFDARRKALGVRADLGFKENYLPQIWENSPEEIASAIGKKRLTLQPKTAMKSIIDTYEEGISHGLTPKYKNITDLMGYYTEVAEKSLADRAFYKSLREKGMIQPSTSKKAKQDWIELPGDVFPQLKQKGGGRISWKASPEVGEIILNYLKPNRGKAMGKALEGIQITKDIALASGLPGTAFNAHGFNMLRRSTAVQGLSGFMNGLKYMTKSGSDASVFSKGLDKILPWKSADKNIKDNMHLLPEIMEHGGRLGVEGHEFGEQIASSLFGKGVNKVKGWHQDLFETHLFDKMIPALKIDYYKSAVKDLSKTMPAAQAKKEAAKAMNLAYAGVNYDELATNKNMLDFARLFLLAPDWYASNIGLAKNAGQSIMNSKHPGSKLYRDAAKGLIGIYAAANVLNKVNSGKFMWDNESGRTFDIDTGTYTVNEKGTKKKVYISPFGTAFDAAKIPFELINNAFKGDIDKLPSTLKNRTSLPAHAAVNFLSNTNDFGERMFGEDMYGRDIPLDKELSNLAFDVALKPVTPAYVQGARGLFTGRMSPLEGFAQTVEAPLVFKSQDQSGRRRRTR